VADSPSLFGVAAGWTARLAATASARAQQRSRLPQKASGLPVIGGV